MKYKIALFDFDGTLADSFPFFVQVFNELADKHHFKRIAPSEIERLRGYNTKQILHYLNIPLWKIPLIGRSFKAMMFERIHEITLFDGVEGMLRALSAHGIILGLVTTNSYENVSYVLTSDLMEMIPHHYCGSSLFGKRLGLKSILQKTGLQSSEAIYIGDEIRDSKAAEAANIAFGAVSWGYTQLDVLKKHHPQEVFFSMEDIIHSLTKPLHRK